MTGANAKIKRIYVGDKQVRPNYQYTPNSNTIVYYPFRFDTKDYSGNQYNMTKYGDAKITNGVLDLSISGSYLSTTVSTIPQGGNDRTNMFWVKYTDTGYRVAYTYGANQNYKGDMFWKNNPLSWGSYGYNINSSTTATAGVWYHIAVTAKSGSSNQKLYINGTLAGTSGYTINTSGTTLYLGKEWSSSGFLKGYLSEFIIEKRIMSQSEIQAFYNKTKSRYGL